MSGTILRSDFSLIDNASKKHAAWGAFKNAMRGKAYGREALNDAWAWYRTGWDDGFNAADSARIAMRGGS